MDSNAEIRMRREFLYFVLMSLLLGRKFMKYKVIIDTKKNSIIFAGCYRSQIFTGIYHKIFR